MPSITRYIAPGRPPKGLITVFRDPDGVFVEAFEAVDVLLIEGSNRFRARCACFVQAGEGEGSTRAEALRNLERALQQHLDGLLAHGDTLEENLLAAGFHEERVASFEELLQQLFRTARMEEEPVLQVEAQA